MRFKENSSQPKQLIELVRPKLHGVSYLPGNRTISTQGHANVSESPFCESLGLWNKSESRHVTKYLKFPNQVFMGVGESRESFMV